MEWRENRIKVSGIEGDEYALCFGGTPYITALKTLPLIDLDDTESCLLMAELEYLFDSNPEGFYMHYEQWLESSDSAAVTDSWYERFGWSAGQTKLAFDNIGIRYDSHDKFEAETDVFKGKYYCSIFNQDRKVPFYLRNPQVDKVIKSVLLPGLTVASIYREIEQRVETNRKVIIKEVEQGNEMDHFQAIARLMNIGGDAANEQ